MSPLDPLDIHRCAQALCAGLDLDKPAVLLVSSALPGEGKSLVSDLLARALLAQTGREILLLAAGPGQAPAAAVGAIETLMTGGEWRADWCAGTGGPRVCRLGHGASFGSGQWFRRPAVGRLLAECRQRAGVTLIDGPVLTQCGALVPASDRVLLVVDARRTPATRVRQALQQTGLGGPRLAGVYLNRQREPSAGWMEA